MSRLAKKPIDIPESVKANLENEVLTVKGPKGELKQKIHSFVAIKIDKNNLTVEIEDKNDKDQKAMQGTFYRLICNMIKGVVEGFLKKLEINGVGYKTSVQNKILTLNVGFSHPVEFNIPDGIEIKTEKNVITVSGIDKQLVGEVAAKIRRIRKPEPYKGTGIKYSDEVIRIKAGKAAKAVGVK